MEATSHTNDAPVPTAQQLNKLLQMEKDCVSATHKPGFVDALTNTHAELTQRKKEENNIRAWRCAQGAGTPDMPGTLPERAKTSRTSPQGS